MIKDESRLRRCGLRHFEFEFVDSVQTGVAWALLHKNLLRGIRAGAPRLRR